MSKADVAVVDYRLNNLASISRALEMAGAGRVRVVRSPDDLGSASHLVVPGVGAFDAAMTNLTDMGWPDAIADLVARGTPLLGICLGMQLLTGGSDEGASAEGLGLIPGRARRLPPAQARVPHVGWNTVTACGPGRTLARLSGLDFYFVHSYAVEVDIAEHASAVTPFGASNFTSAISVENVSGVQFHPEKSSQAGVRLLQGFIDYGTPC